MEKVKKRYAIKFCTKVTLRHPLKVFWKLTGTIFLIYSRVSSLKNRLKMAWRRWRMISALDGHQRANVSCLIAETLTISKTTVRYIITHNLQMRKVCQIDPPPIID